MSVFVSFLLFSHLCSEHTKYVVKKCLTPAYEVHVLFHLLVVFFLSPGNVWIYSIYRPDFQKNLTNPDMYCNKTLYLYAFWTTTLVYILFAVFLLGGCCILVCFCLCGNAAPRWRRLGASHPGRQCMNPTTAACCHHCTAKSQSGNYDEYVFPFSFQVKWDVYSLSKSTWPYKYRSKYYIFIVILKTAYKWFLMLFRTPTQEFIRWLLLIYHVFFPSFALDGPWPLLWHSCL